MLRAARWVVVGSFFFGVLATACVGEADSETEAPADETEGALRSVSTWLVYEGSCEFLRTCSTWSRGLPKGKVLWGCSAENTSSDGDREYGSCDDKALWVAGPTRASCGKTAHICKGDICVDAKVKDISVSKRWEASNAVMAALDLPYGLSNGDRCSGFGGGNVKITAR